MRFVATVDTDVGIVKNINQDAALMKHALINQSEVLLAIVCDGMGGLEKGELASATVIRAFANWFDEELPFELENIDMGIIGEKWSLLLRELNVKLFNYSNEKGMEGIGTTFTGILLVDNQYVIGHIGDTRVYDLSHGVKQLTTDHTLVAREIRCGNLTEEQAKTDKRRNLLLQCIGAAKTINPEIICGEIKKGAYMICSDGFRHEITEREIYESLNPINLMNKDAMHNNVKYLIELVKQRNEKDNISVILIKVK